MIERPIRVLMAKLGLDWHNWGLRVLTAKLRDAGMEVIYQEQMTPEEVVKVAIEEDVDVIGLSSLTGAYRVLAPEVMRLLKEKSANDVLVIVGGLIYREDIPSLKEAGVAEVFGLRTPTKSVVDFIKGAVSTKQ